MTKQIPKGQRKKIYLVAFCVRYVRVCGNKWRIRITMKLHSELDGIY